MFKWVDQQNNDGVGVCYAISRINRQASLFANLNMCEAEIVGLYPEKDTFAALYK